MPTLNGGIVAGYLFDDFTFLNDNGLINENQNGPFTLPNNAQLNLAQGADLVSINVDDDDPDFEDGFQENGLGPGNQSLVNTVSFDTVAGDTVTFNEDDILEVEFTLTATPVGGGDPISLLFVAIGGAENAGQLQMVVTTALLDPNITYDITFANDGGGTPYLGLICFVAGARIATPGGARAVETLRPGDAVLTHNSAPATLVWTGRRVVTTAEMAANPELRPVRIAAGALGPNTPEADLYVSPQHRILVSGPKVELLFDMEEALTSALSLCGAPGVAQVAPDHDVAYHHIMCREHQVILAEGAPTESFYAGAEALRALDVAAAAELFALFPDLVAAGPGAAARPILKRSEALALAS
ncbi:MAG: Hint domain-containing protein [Pseudomonadota bacterium]